MLQVEQKLSAVRQFWQLLTEQLKQTPLEAVKPARQLEHWFSELQVTQLATLQRMHDCWLGPRL